MMEIFLRQQVFDYVKKTFKSEPEYLWKRFPDYAVFRHKDNRKWFGIVMDISRDKLGLDGSGLVDVLNVKIDDPVYHDALLQQEGILPGYHLNHGNWISILLDGTVGIEQVCDLIDAGYEATAPAKKKRKIRPPKEWIIPANPKFYDVEQAFENSDEIDWKQGNGIKAGDTVYMYLAAPVSTIMYRCKVLETDIPYAYRDDNLTIKALMKIKLEKRYKPERFTFEVLKEEYGIYAIRGPRGIPNSLSAALKR